MKNFLGCSCIPGATADTPLQSQISFGILIGLEAPDIHCSFLRFHVALRLGYGEDRTGGENSIFLQIQITAQPMTPRFFSPHHPRYQAIGRESINQSPHVYASE